MLDSSCSHYPLVHSSAGVAMEGHLGRPEAGKRFSQYSRRALKHILVGCRSTLPLSDNTLSTFAYYFAAFAVANLT